MSQRDKDFTPGGLKINGAYENDRNADSADLFKEIIREACGVSDVIIAHHLVYVRVERRDGFEFQIVEEIPSADALIFDHEIAKKIWGPESYMQVLRLLAFMPPEQRDEKLRELWEQRKRLNAAAKGDVT